MRTTPSLFFGTLMAVFLVAMAFEFANAEADNDAAYYNRQIGRGVNLGNALEAPHEGDWGLTLREEYFEEIKRAGFNSVRIPVKWSSHAGQTPPYTIDPTFLNRVDWAVDQTLHRGMTAILNVHNYDEMNFAPDEHLPRLTALWAQIADHFRNRPDRLIFELLNEPNGKLTDDLWNSMIPRLLAVVRKSNPRRIVIVGPSQWNSFDHLEKLVLPESDRRLIVTFHYYNPFQFTHQGASWVQGSDRWKGTTWKGSEKQLEALRRDFDKAAAWAREKQRPLFMGEFGAYSQGDMDSRVLWTHAVAREAEKRGFSWGYWEFGAGFGIYDPASNAWRRPLLQALTGQ